MDFLGIDWNKVGEDIVGILESLPIGKAIGTAVRESNETKRAKIALEAERLEARNAPPARRRDPRWKKRRVERLIQRRVSLLRSKAVDARRAGHHRIHPQAEARREAEFLLGILRQHSMKNYPSIPQLADIVGRNSPARRRARFPHNMRTRVKRPGVRMPGGFEDGVSAQERAYVQSYVAQRLAAIEEKMEALEEERHFGSADLALDQRLLAISDRGESNALHDWVNITAATPPTEETGSPGTAPSLFGYINKLCFEADDDTEDGPSARVTVAGIPGRTITVPFFKKKAEVFVGQLLDNVTLTITFGHISTNDANFRGYYDRYRRPVWPGGNKIGREQIVNI